MINLDHLAYNPQPSYLHQSFSTNQHAIKSSAISRDPNKIQHYDRTEKKNPVFPISGDHIFFYKNFNENIL